MGLIDSGWPVPEESRDGWWDGLAYPLYDMRPQGYLGRQFARAEHHQFAVSTNPDQWDIRPVGDVPLDLRRRQAKRCSSLRGNLPRARRLACSPCPLRSGNVNGGFNAPRHVETDCHLRCF